MFYENENFKISIDDRNIEPSGLSNEKILKIILQNRNISDDEVSNFLQNYNINSIDPFEFPDMEKSIEIISKFITQGKKIGVYGDFDADGLTGTAILIETIDNLGGIAKPFIPHREDEGHGISKNGLMSLIDFGCELIITVDTGTNSFDLIEEIINEKNINFIITDHHIPEKKSFSYPILNPVLDENITDYSGAGVAWILSKAIYQHFEKPMKEGLTSLATIGTVADVAPLQKNNRIIVKNGLIEIAKSQNFAINALNNISGKKFFFEPPEAEYISFSLAPRINTPGRISDAYTSLNLLTAKNSKIAHNISQKVEQMNDKRKSLSLELWEKKQEEIKSQINLPIIFLDCTGYPLGLLGPLAGRLVDDLSKPVFCYANKDNVYKFSSRSNESYDLFNSLSKLERYFINFGGHSLAAGFSIKSDDYNEFYKEIIEAHEFKFQKSRKNYNADLEININHLNYNLWDELKKLSPFGEKNPEPIFYTKNITLDNIRSIGSDKNHISGKLSNNHETFDFIGFNIMKQTTFSNKKVSILYKLRTDFWNGKKQKKIQILEITTA